MKKIIGIFLVSLFLLSVAALPALAHVHGVTPLLGLSCNVDNSITGGNRADDQDNPITGLIPRDVGNAPLSPGDGGFGATTANC